MTTSVRMRYLLPEMQQHQLNTWDAVLAGARLEMHHVDHTLCWESYGVARCTRTLGHDGLHQDDRPCDGIPAARWLRTADGKVLGWGQVTLP